MKYREKFTKEKRQPRRKPGAALSAGTNLISGSLLRPAEWGLALGYEAGATLLASELYAFGMLSPRIPRIRPLFLRDQSKSPPILFIHGIFHNRSAFAWLSQRLAWHGWRHFNELNLFTTLYSIPKLADQVGKAVDALLAQTGAKEVDIIGHSMGGIIARYYVQNGKGDGKVKNLITLGTPHQGTGFGKYSVLPQFKELAPKSETLRLLNENPVPRYTQGLAVMGTLDPFARPTGSGWWPGVRNVVLKGVGHAGILFSTRVSQLIISRLSTNRI